MNTENNSGVPTIVSTPRDINLPYPNPSWIYEGYDEVKFEDWTGLVLNRAPKQIQDNIRYMLQILNDLTKRVETGTPVLTQKINIVADTQEVYIDKVFKNPIVMENGVPQDEICYSFESGKLTFGHILYEGVQILIMESREV